MAQVHDMSQVKDEARQQREERTMEGSYTESSLSPSTRSTTAAFTLSPSPPSLRVLADHLLTPVSMSDSASLDGSTDDKLDKLDKLLQKPLACDTGTTPAAKAPTGPEYLPIATVSSREGKGGKSSNSFAAAVENSLHTRPVPPLKETGRTPGAVIKTQKYREQHCCPPAWYINSTYSIASTASRLTRVVRPTAFTPSTVTPSSNRTWRSVSVELKHPTPDYNYRFGSCRARIETLELKAELLTRTDSIELAIRKEQNTLKRIDRHRSFILKGALAAKNTAGPAHSVPNRQFSTSTGRLCHLDLKKAALKGGYPTAGHVMNSTHSRSIHSGRSRSSSSSKTSSRDALILSDQSDAAAVLFREEENRIPRKISDKASPRSRSSHDSHVSKTSLAVVFDSDLPVTLTQEALDAADHAEANGCITGVDETFKENAHQPVDSEFVKGIEHVPDLLQGTTSERLPFDQPHQDPRSSTEAATGRGRCTTATSTTTNEQAHHVFHDFDGAHCDPDTTDFPKSLEPELPSLQQQPGSRSVAGPRSRPHSYFDASNGQEMLYYPAHLPAVLNLPPKLAKGKKKATHALDIRRSLILGASPMLEKVNSWQMDTSQFGSFSPPGSGSESATGSNRSLRPRLESGPDNQTNTGRDTSLRSLTHGGHEYPMPPPVANGRSLASMEELSAKFRAQSFFDLTTASSRLELQGGSAITTLERILDASATAPVTAFTGTSGQEVQGLAKKSQQSKKTKPSIELCEAKPEVILPAPGQRKLVKRNKSSELLSVAQVPRKRASFFSLLGVGKRESKDRQKAAAGNRDDVSPGRQDSPSPNDLVLATGGGSDRSDEEGGEGEEGEEIYRGRPTTLIAELQQRKYQQKLRTRPPAEAYPNGMHSSLLELDAVYEMENKSRSKRRVNLAWEDGTMGGDHNDDVDDEDVPLGLLYMAKASGANGVANMDMSALMGEVNRPLGLMERRELEENEPLSRRRERLQGVNPGKPGPTPLTLEQMQKRMTSLNLMPASNALGKIRSQSQLTLPLHNGRRFSDVSGGGGWEKTSEQDETLAERKARLAAENVLPQARPVSTLSSAQILHQPGLDREKDQASYSEIVPEEEETLGQRRRRLKAEREARELEMAAAGTARSPTPMPHLANLASNHARKTSATDRGRNVSRRLSLADMLSAHPVEAAVGPVHPRELERQKREADAARTRREQESKMAVLRSQMPATLSTVSLGAPHGGFLGGALNDGSAGLTLAARRASHLSLAAGGHTNTGQGTHHRPHNLSMLGMPHHGPTPYAMVNKVAAGYGTYGLQPPQTQTHLDMVEQWRQSVV